MLDENSQRFSLQLFQNISGLDAGLEGRSISISATQILEFGGSEFLKETMILLDSYLIARKSFLLSHDHVRYLLRQP